MTECGEQSRVAPVAAHVPIPPEIIVASGVGSGRNDRG